MNAAENRSRVALLQAETIKRNANGMAPSSHGTESCYINQRCRCPECKAAANTARLGRKAKQRRRLRA